MAYYFPQVWSIITTPAYVKTHISVVLKSVRCGIVMQEIGCEDMSISSICLPKMNDSNSAVAAVWHCRHHPSEKFKVPIDIHGEIISLKS
jgi:hypothetical protein